MKQKKERFKLSFYTLNPEKVLSAFMKVNPNKIKKA